MKFSWSLPFQMSRGSDVSIETGPRACRPGNSGSIPAKDKIRLSLLKFPERLRGPRNLQLNWYRGRFPRDASGHCQAEYSPAFRGEIRNEWSYASTALRYFHEVQQGKRCLYFSFQRVSINAFSLS
jgi:hypothetical protein